MPSCVIKICRSNTRNSDKSKGVTFHRFPSVKDWRDAWIQIIRESRNETEWCPMKSSLICCKHFEDCDFYTTKCGRSRLIPYSVPKKFLHIYEMSATASSSPVPHKESSEESLGIVTPPPGVDIEQPLSVLYSPKQRRMKERLIKMHTLVVSHKKKIKSLNQKVRRLQARNKSLMDILDILKQENYVDPDLLNRLNRNITATNISNKKNRRKLNKKVK